MAAALSPRQATADPCLWRRPSNTQRQGWLSLLWESPFLSLGSGDTRFCLCPPSILASMRFDIKCDCTSPTILMRLLLGHYSWGIFLWWVPHSPVNSCSATICDFDVLTGEGERISFYSTILVSYALGTKMFMWLAFLWYSLYCSGLEPNPHLQGLSVFYILQKTMQTSEKVSNIKARAQRNRGRHNETIYLRLRLGLEPNQTPAWDLNPCGWDSTQPKPMVPGFRT